MTKDNGGESALEKISEHLLKRPSTEKQLVRIIGICAIILSVLFGAGLAAGSFKAAYDYWMSE